MTTPGKIRQALEDSLQNAPPAAADEGGVELARHYADLLDSHWPLVTAYEVFDKLGPRYLAVLTALGLTPAGRAAGGGERGGPILGGKLDELRARRERRGTG